MSSLLFLLVIFGFSNIDAARILAIFPAPSISHQVVFRPIVQELIKRGHEVTVITTDPAYPKGQAPANLTEIDLHNVSYSTWTKYVEKIDGSSTNWIGKLLTIFKLIQKIFEEEINDEVVQEHLFKGNASFDLLLAEACVRMTLGLSHVFKVPAIQISSFGSVSGNYEALGAPFHPFLYPNMFRSRINNLTIWEKVVEFYNEIQFHYILHSLESDENVTLKRLFGDDTPSIRELYENVALLLLNVHPIWDNNRPVPPNIVFMGGVHQKPEQKLPMDIQTYLNSSKNGVIYVSFGTNVIPSMLPQEKINILKKVFSELPYDVLLKWNEDELPGRSKNVKISKWLPQADLLRHPKIKLFITQGGQQSTDEAITAGVPLVGIPMLADQWYNVEKYVLHEIGVGLDMRTLSEEKLKTAITTVIGDESYRQNIVRLRKVMYDQPQKPLERAVWWIEHVLRHGGAPHLRTPAASLYWTEYFEIKLVLLLAAMCLTVCTAVCTIAFLIWKNVNKNISSGKLKVS